MERGWGEGKEITLVNPARENPHFGSEKLHFGSEKLHFGSAKLHQGSEKVCQGRKKVYLGRKKVYLGNEKVYFKYNNYQNKKKEINILFNLLKLIYIFYSKYDFIFSIENIYFYAKI